VRPLPCPNTTVGKLHPEAEILLMTENETNTRTGEKPPVKYGGGRLRCSPISPAWLRDSRVTGKCKDGAVAKRYQRVPELVLGFDTETTGLSVSSERAVSYGFCAYRFGVPVWSEQFFVIPDRPISPGAKGCTDFLSRTSKRSGGVNWFTASRRTATRGADPS